MLILIAMLKQILIVFTFLTISLGVAAKEPASDTQTETFYIQLVSRQRMGSKDESAKLEVGREFVQLTGAGEAFQAAVRQRRFPTLLDGLNVLAVNGWSLVSTSSKTVGGGTEVTWILKKTVVERGELLDGLGN